MFFNLKAELARKGLSGTDIATTIGATQKTVSNKMLGKSEFTREEMFKIKNQFFADMTLEYLFAIE